MGALDLAVRIISGLLMGEAVSVVTQVGGVTASLWGLVDDVLLLIMKGGMSISEQFALTALFQESEKILEEAEYQDTHDRRQREARARWLRKENPHTIYVYGNVSAQDIGILAYSAETLAERGTPQVVMQAVFDIYDLLLDIGGVALVT